MRTKLVQLRFLPVIFYLLAATVAARASDWYRWRGPDLNGISTETGWQSKWPDEGPKRLWKASVGLGFSSMTVSHGRVYTMGNDGTNTDTVYCLDAATGAVVWEHPYACPVDAHFYEGGTSGTPTVDGDHVYSLSRKGDLFCFDAAKGNVVWARNVNEDWNYDLPDWGFAGSPLVQGGLLVLNVGSAGLALNKKTGEIIWHSEKTVPGYSTPVLCEKNGEKLVVVAAKESVEAVRLADGKSVWRFPWKTQYDLNAADPVISDGKIFVSSGYDHGGAQWDISGSKPKVVWENKTFRNHIASSVLWHGFLYGVDDLSSTKYELKCVSWITGEAQWSEPGFGKGTLIIANGKIIGLSDKGELIVAEASPAGFKPISSAQVLGGKCWTTPVLANGQIYCRNQKGDLVCLDVSGK